MGDRVIYDAGLPRNVTVASIINDNMWHWPVENSPDLLVLKKDTLGLSYNPDGNQDSIHWLPSPSGHFSICTAWDHIRQVKAPVPWKHIVWFSRNLPKASFILWLAIKGRLAPKIDFTICPLTLAVYCVAFNWNLMNISSLSALTVINSGTLSP